VDCPRCGHAILDPDPNFCPKCGYEMRKNEVRNQPQGETAPSVLETPNARAGSPDSGYYLLVLLAFVGGIIGYRAVRGRNPRVAATILTISLLVSVVYVGAGFEVYSTLSKPQGTYDMTISSVTFPDHSTVAVTISNRGTLEDGLESVAINNGTLWLVFGMLQPGSLTYGLYGYILANGTTVTVPGLGSVTIGTESVAPSHQVVIDLPYGWIPSTTYTVAITTTSRHPFSTNVESPSLIS